ncbi:hypothetical protein KY316_00515, partial [Candidatus Woesearchaeota archaeon]|nr:hypothetical protein [Candidatus Woesearchaeota archaeon]
HSIITNHRQSPVEFSRKDKFVICSEGFKVQTLSIKDLQNFIISTNEFFNEVNSITAKHEKLFSRR